MPSSTVAGLAEVGIDVLAMVVNHIHDGVLITDSASRILWANPAYCRITGYGIEALQGRTPAMLRPHDAEPVRAREIWDSLGACGRFDGRLLNQRADGSLFHASVSILRLPRPGDAGGYYLCTMRDVSVDVEFEAHLASAAAQAAQARDTTILALASLAEQRDTDTGAHLQRIEAYSRLMAEWLLAEHPTRFPEWARDAQTIGRCAMLHDIGKVGVPDAILRKPGRLDAAEQEIMRQHPRLGAEILDRVIRLQEGSPFLCIARTIIAFHHEAYDGTGYPFGLRGDEIPLVAQLTTVADVLDALTSRRAYKPAYCFAEAVAWITERSGSAFGPLAVAALQARLPEAEAIHAALGDPPTEHGIKPSGISRPPPTTARPPPPPVPPARTALAEALAEALAAEGGEVVVRSGPEVGRLYLWRGRVAWAQLSSRSDALTRRLVEDEGLDEDDLRTVVEDCKQTGRAFGDLLVESGLVTRATFRRVLRGHLAERVGAMLDLPDAVALFVPQPRSCEGDLTFSLDELRASI